MKDNTFLSYYGYGKVFHAAYTVRLILLLCSSDQCYFIYLYAIIVFINISN